MSELEWSHDEDCWSHVGEDCSCLLGPFENLKATIQTITRKDAVDLIRLCARTLEEDWHRDIKQARANWLREFATELEKARKDAKNS